MPAPKETESMVKKKKNTVTPEHNGTTATDGKDNISMQEDEVKQSERRGQKRYPVREGAYALMRQPANKIGQIIDISMTGLTFSYLSIGPDDRNKESAYMDLLAEDGLIVENLSIKPVNKTIIPNKQSFSHLNIWRQSVKFENLSEHQTRALQSLIKQYKKDDNNQ